MFIMLVFTETTCVTGKVKIVLQFYVCAQNSL